MPSGRQIALILFAAIGITLVLLGVTWRYWHSPQSYWSKEQAAEYTDAWRALKVVATSGIRPGDPKSNPKLAAAQDRFDAIKSKLDHARTRNEYAGTALTVAGIIVLAGTIFFLGFRFAEPKAE
jgi:hypothetical protein